MTIHVLKVDDEYYGELARNEKPFEVRKDDRTPAFATGDAVIFVHATAPDRRVARKIGYVLRGKHVPEGYVVFQVIDLSGDEEGAAWVAFNNPVSR